MKHTVKSIIALCAAALAMTSCFNLDEQTFDKIDASAFYQNESSVEGAVASIYYSAANGFVEYDFYLQEFPADQVVWRVWNGGLWGYDEGEKYVLSVHSWTPESKIIRSAWENAWTTIGLCNQVISDLKDIDATSIGMTSAGVNSYIAEVQTIRAWQYYQIFELWGGSLPLNVSVSTDVPGSASKDFNEGCKLIYNFISEELDNACGNLVDNGLNRMSPAANRVLKARLLLNAETFIGENHFSDCATLCQEIIDGKYGNYSLASDYREIFGYGNESCKEIIFAFADDFAHVISNMVNIRDVPFLPYNYSEFTQYTTVMSGWNCTCLAPSYDNSGNVQTYGGTDAGVCFLDAPYNDKLGAVYARFSDKDVRKQSYTWEGDNYKGIFLKGAMKNAITGEAVKADADRDQQDLVYVDQLGTFQNLGRNLETVMSPRWGETNSGYRLMKYPMAPEETGLHWEDIDEVEIRLSEVYYMLAECKLRSGDGESAKGLVNQVRKRYFSAADWATEENDPGRCSSSFDEAWMLDQWGQEFLCEGRRRRTDLRRFNQFTQGRWWFFGRATEEGYNLPEKRDTKYEWYPLPASAISVNPGLVQNPNY